MKFNTATFSVVLSLSSSALALPTEGRRMPMPAVHMSTRTLQPEYHTYTYTSYQSTETEYVEWEEEDDGFEDDGLGLELGIDVLDKRQELDSPIPISIPSPEDMVPSDITEPFDTMVPSAPYIEVIDEDGTELPVEIIPLPEIPTDVLQSNQSTSGANATSSAGDTSTTATPTSSATVSSTANATSSTTVVDNSTTSTTNSASATPTEVPNIVENFVAVSQMPSLPLPSGFAAPTAPLPGVLPPLLSNGTIPNTTAAN